MNQLNHESLPEWISRISPEDYNYDLPQEKIAQFPIKQRDRSKLLVYKNGIVTDSIFNKIHEYLPSESLMVLNNSRVIKARLLLAKETGAVIEVFCLEPSSPADYSISIATSESVEWKCIIGNARKWKSGKIGRSFQIKNQKCILEAEHIGKDSEESWLVRFSWVPKHLTFGEVIEHAGHVPLPPYIEREDEKSDALRYQTIYSNIDGSVAAPTAGLHFTADVFKKLSQKGIDIEYVTLHVGAGTFKPVKSKSITGHKMHREYFFTDIALIKKLLEKKSPVTAVGTTSLRVLESIYWAGVRIKTFPHQNDSYIPIDQWDPYRLKTTLNPTESLEILCEWMEQKGYKRFFASTGLLIIPGYDFKIPDILITNFHLPYSTLLMLISAWVGTGWKKIYNHALQNNYRFLSYGDSSLLFKK